LRARASSCSRTLKLDLPSIASGDAIIRRRTRL
jgi:hypothetical protein